MNEPNYTENGIVVPDIIDRLMAINHADAADGADEIEELRQAIWDACRILGMNANDGITSPVHTNFATLIIKEAVRSTFESQKEIERLQDIEDRFASKIEALREQVEWSSTRASEWKLETYQLKAEIEQLDAALRVAADKLSTLPPYTEWQPETIYKALMEDGTEEARRG